MLDTNETWDFLLENGIASEETLLMVIAWKLWNQFSMPLRHTDQ